MTTLHEFIDYLKGLPPDTEISVLRSYDYGYATGVDEAPLDIDPITGNVDFTDLTGNQFVKDDDPRANKKYLTLGCQE